MNNPDNKIVKMFRSHFGNEPKTISSLPQTASNRIYFRLENQDNSAIGVYNPDERENDAFIYLADHFKVKDLNVPEVYSYQKSDHIYLQQDLGDETLYSLLLKEKKEFSDEIIYFYKKSVEHLVNFQDDGRVGLDFKKCYPREKFDEQSIQWDLNYFKYYFLKLSKIQFDEQLLEDDFNKIIDQITSVSSDYFLYRDFQSRNIMIKGNQLYFIDFQGGRKGPLHYDIASLLYDAKADLSDELRNELLEFYLDTLPEKNIQIDKTQFKDDFYLFVLIRILQALGAYGYRGFFEGKSHFLQSIPFALNNLNSLITNDKIKIDLSYLISLLKSLRDSHVIKDIIYDEVTDDKLKVTITSFSYKKGLPVDTSGNGGGFVFDCRAIHNPGRFDEYKTLTGKDKAVIKFINEKTEIKSFLKNVFEIVDSTVENYLERNFKDLSVSFGCTGGQHRSVFSAEKLAAHLKNKFDVNVVLKHRELESKND